MTFEPYSRTFERLLPLREALLRDEQHVFDDLVGDLAEYDDLVTKHDSGLVSLRERAVRLYLALVEAPAFRECFGAVMEQLRQEDSRDLPEASEEQTWLGYVAAEVVNDLPADLTSRWSHWRVWNAGAARFKAVAPAEARSALSEERARFAGTAKAVLDGLFRLRKALSRKYDIPVAPAGRPAIAGDLD